MLLFVVVLKNLYFLCFGLAFAYYCGQFHEFMQNLTISTAAAQVAQGPGSSPPFPPWGGPVAPRGAREALGVNNN